MNYSEIIILNCNDTKQPSKLIQIYRYNVVKIICNILKRMKKKRSGKRRNLLAEVTVSNDLIFKPHANKYMAP